MKVLPDHVGVVAVVDPVADGAGRDPNQFAHVPSSPLAGVPLEDPDGENGSYAWTGGSRACSSQNRSTTSTSEENSAGSTGFVR